MIGFISEGGSKLFEGVVNCAVAWMLLYGVVMKRTLLIIQDIKDYVIYNLITGKSNFVEIQMLNRLQSIFSSK